ncbi:MAG: hypothetical protein QN152_11285 [Armatimonadota bacterium]|nr:hypothetical protein [Armatimonadota bacterium]MDR7469852.1 hypothetical protein [Armatimonadota bacterium]MDR7475187.1 hypothetical protein [Armatimonadota bacterium]MDR7540091.1 hypothetical protein [Armatimonadota bacterium]
MRARLNRASGGHEGMVTTRLLRRTTYGVPRPRPQRSGGAILAWTTVLLVLAGVALVLRVIRWADRNL